jgi:hypothetical protein
MVDVLVLYLASSIATDPSDAGLRSAIIAHTANIESFRRYDCTFRVTQAVANNELDAIAGNLQNGKSYLARLVVDGDKDHYWDFVTKEEIPKAVKLDKKTSVISAFASGQHLISDGKNQAAYEPIMKMLAVRPFGKAKSELVPNTPLGLGREGFRDEYGIDKMLALSDTVLKNLGVKPIRDIPCIGGLLQIQQPGRHEIEIWMDPAASYLPRRMEIRYGSLPNTVQVTEVLSIDGQRHFPQRIVRTISRKGSNSVMVFETVVTNLTVDKPVDPAVLRVSVPAGTSVTDQSTDRLISFFKLKQDESFGPDDVATLIEMLETHKLANQTGKRLDTSIDAYRPSRFRGWVFVIPSLLLLTIYWFWRGAGTKSPL